MELRSQTNITYFILLGFSQNLLTSVCLFVIFFAIYTIIVLGNGFLIFTVIASPKLHTPMYYFLCNLSFLDLCCPSCSVPKLLVDIFSQKRRISLIGCLTQTIFSLFLAVTESILLAVMAYDRYIAICSPLYYTVIMSWRVCRYITVFMWSGSFIVSSFPLIIKPLVFCKGNTLNHFACEILVLLEVACGDVSFYKLCILAIGFFTLLSPLVLIVVSYICILMSILKIHSAHGRPKAFSTCSSHLTVVSMYFVTIIIMYMGQRRSFFSYLKFITVIYAVFTPLLNPLIYSLRNNEVKEAFWKTVTAGSVRREMT